MLAISRAIGSHTCFVLQAEDHIFLTDLIKLRDIFKVKSQLAGAVKLHGWFVAYL